MSRFNTTVQQYTPLIQYAPPNAWGVGSPKDSQFSKYSDGFRLTTANGSTATLEFNGTGVWIYGAYRLNHGNYSVTLDGELKGIFSGSKKDDFQVILFGAGGLDNTKHSVVLTNIPLSVNNNYVDIDFITYEVPLGQQSIGHSVQVDMSSRNWTYDQSWGLENDTTQGAPLSSTTSGAKATLTFQGEYVEIYGSTGPLNSQFDVSVDGGAPTTLDCFYDESRSSVLLWSANSLGDRLHKLEITNRPNSTSLNRLELDYAVVRGATVSNGASTPASTTASVFPTNSPLNNTAFKSNTGAIIGCVIAAVVSLVIIAAAALHWWRKKRLGQRPPSSYTPRMSSSGNILPFTNPSSGSGSRGNHPKFGAHARGTPANPATYGNMPPDRVPIINSRVSLNESSLSSNVGSGSQLSSSTTTSTNVVFQPMPLPMSSYPPDSRAAYQPQEPSTTPEPRTQPLPAAQAHTPPESQQTFSSHGQASAAGQPHSTSPFVSSSDYTSYSASTPSPGMQSSYAYHPHPQSIFGDGDDTPGGSRLRSETMSPPPDYWSSASQGAR